MRSYPVDKYDFEEAEDLKIDNWILDILKMNPEYVFWGPYEDYMCVEEGKGWNARVIHDTWEEFKKNWKLDDLNEVVNFYFEASRNNVKCETCGGCGNHPDAQWITESFYRHSSPFCLETQQEIEAKTIMKRFGGDYETAVVEKGFPSEHILKKYPDAFRHFCEEMLDGDGFWHNKITQDELDLLIEKNRFPKDSLLVEVNQEEKFGLRHDAINRMYLCEKRCEILGVPFYCSKCQGIGENYTEEKAHLGLILWILHPRKGCSRGIHIKNVYKEDLKSVFSFLREAEKRNTERFSKILDIE